MKILYFCQLYPPAIYGGGEYIFFQWARELVKRGHEVFTITQRLSNISSKDFEEIDGIKIYRVGPSIQYKGSLPPSIKDNAGYLFSAFFKGIDIIKENKIDIIHSNTYSPAYAGQLCSMFTGKAHVITFHDLYLVGNNAVWDNWSNQTGVSRYTSFIAPLIERLALLLPASLVHTVSDTSKNELIPYIANKPIITIPNGVLLQDYDYNVIKDNERHEQVNVQLSGSFVLYVGRLVFYKNLQTVINCFDKVIKEIPSAKLVIVGDGPFRKQLESDAIHLEENVVFTGRVSDTEKIRLLHESSFFVFPSLVEGFGIVILEAYTQKKPVLASNVMPLPELVEDGVTGFTIPPFDENMWSEKIIYCLKNIEKTKLMGLKGYEKLTQHYTIERIVDQMEKTYFDLIKDRQNLNRIE